MGGHNRSKTPRSSFSIFNIFKSKKGRRGDDHYDRATMWDEASTTSKVWPSDEDKGHRWVAEPGIDRKAKDYIDRIHQNRIFETERQTVTINPIRSKLDA